MIHRALLGSLRALHRHPHRALRAARSRSGSRRCRPIVSRSPTATGSTPAGWRQSSRRGVRADVNASGETLGKRIRTAELEKIPYVLVVGDTEAEGETLALRLRGERDVIVKPRAEALDELAQAARL